MEKLLFFFGSGSDSNALNMNDRVSILSVRKLVVSSRWRTVHDDLDRAGLR
jgi:hypothetical protein